MKLSGDMKSIAMALVVLAAAGALAERVVVAEGDRMGKGAIGAMEAHPFTLLGRWRGVAANVMWLRLHAAWERRDVAEVEALVRLVPEIDPRSTYFWRNGTRIVAYDLPVWRIAAAGGYAVVPEEEQRRIGREQALTAVAFLERALAIHPQSAELWVERANIEYGRLRDFAAAAASYRRAAELPEAPEYAARLHAEMLRRAGRKAEARAWLAKVYAGLVVERDEGAAEVVLERIRELEAETQAVEGDGRGGR